MTITEAIRERHSVRSYQDKPIDPNALQSLRTLMDECNERGELEMQMVVDDPTAFDSRLAHYGHFTGVNNYIALVGAKGKDLDERLGYWGEHLVLQAQMLGLNTCWVGLTYKKNRSAVSVDTGHKMRGVIAVGYGNNRGVAHRVKPVEKVARLAPALLAKGAPMPEWFTRGVEAALLAPTAMNQQKFLFTLQPHNRVLAQSGWGFFAKMDLGIAKYHFELSAGQANFRWA